MRSFSGVKHVIKVGIDFSDMLGQCEGIALFAFSAKIRACFTKQAQILFQLFLAAPESFFFILCKAESTLFAGLSSLCAISS